MPDESAAGSINIVLSVNKANFSAAMEDAQRQLDKFAGKSKEAGHSSASSMQAVSASLRAMHGGFENNIRSVERWISQSKLASGIAKSMFPIVGAATFGFMIVDLGMKVAAFIKTAQNMPKAITNGFNALNLSGQTSVDQLKLTNDELQNTINKLQGKPQNNAKIALDETKISADKLAESIAAASTKMDTLLSQNKLNDYLGLVLGKRGTADREGTVKYYGGQQSEAALRIQQSVASGDKNGEAKARADLKSSQDSEYKNMLLDIESQKAGQKAGAGDGSANIAIDTGVATNLLIQRNQQAEEERNAKLVPQQKSAQASHEAAIKAAEASKKAAEAFRKNLDQDLENWNAAQRLTQDMARATTAHNQEFYKSNGLSTDDQKSISEQGKGASAYVQSLRQSIELSRQNAAAISESSLQMAVATGRMTRMDAAQVVANIHTSDYNRALEDLKDQRDSIANDPQFNGNELARKAALQDNTNRANALNGMRGIQSAQDDQNTNPASSSGLVGAKDALNEFTLASKDSASQIRDFTTSTITGFNDLLLKIMTTPHSTGLQNRQALGNYGAGLARSVAGMGLQHAEGSVLGAFGFGGGKMGTQANPMWTRSADGVKSAIGSAGSFLKGMFGGSKGPGQAGLNTALGIAGNPSSGVDTIASTLTDMIPFFASGSPGSISGPAIVGEQGPELFVPSGTGNIIPNHKLTSGGSGGNTIYVDASNSTDPAQTRMQVIRGIQSAAPHISAATISSQNQDRRRTPPSRRKS